MDSAYDRALREAGLDGVFQIKFDVFYNVLLMFTWSTVYMNIILALVIVPHHCELPPKPENVSEFSWKLQYLPSKENVNGQKTFSSCSMYTHSSTLNETSVCQNYTYDKTWYASTVASENNWVCDKELYVTNIYVYMRIGEIFGSVIFGWGGDKFGRRPTYIISLFLIILGRVISLLANQSYILFVCGCVIASLPSWFATQSATVISVEISSPQRRTITTSLKNIFFSIDVAIMAFIYWWLREWKTFLAVTTVTLLPHLLLSWICVSASYSVLILSSGEKVDGNPFLEFAWQSVAEIPAIFIGAWLADNIGRRYTGCIAFGMTTVSWIYLALYESAIFTWIQIWWIRTIVVAACRLTTTISYIVITLFNMELYPTCLRHSGMSLGNIFSSGASALGPYILYIGHHFDSKLPGVILAVISTIGVISSMLLPETLNSKLPETIEEVTAFRKKHQYSSVLTSLPKVQTDEQDINKECL